MGHVTACVKLCFCLHPMGPPVSLILVPPPHLLSVDPAVDPCLQNPPSLGLLCAVGFVAALGVHYSELPPRENLAAFLFPFQPHVGLFQGVTFALGIPDGLAKTSCWLRMFPTLLPIASPFLGVKPKLWAKGSPQIHHMVSHPVHL